MNQHMRITLAFIAILAFCNPAAQAQLVNMEETWQEFLSNKKASNISELVKPEKGQAANYVKYCLIYANTYFCGDNMRSADEMMKEIELMGKDVRDKIPGYEERYEGLKEKIKAYKDFDPLWKKFKNDRNSVSRQDVEALSAASNICERGTLCKYFYIISYDYFCDLDLKNARTTFDSRVRKLTGTTFNPRNVEGLGEEVEKMDKFWVAMDEMTPAWEAYMQTNISPGMVADMPVFDCYVIPNMKVCLLKAAHDLCTIGEVMLKQLRELEQKSLQPIPDEITEKIAWLDEQVSTNKTDLAVVNTYWKKFISTDKVPADAVYKYEFACDREAEIKAYLLDGFVHPCTKGAAALESIATIRKTHKPDMNSVTSEKLKKLQELVAAENKNVAALDKAWADFLPDDKLSGTLDLSLKYCNNADQIRAYIIDGLGDVCANGKKRVEDIDDVLAENEVELEAKVAEKLEKLRNLAAKVKGDLEGLKNAWDFYVKNERVSHDLNYEHDFFCDREADVQAFILDGFTNLCQSGEYALNEIDRVMKAHNPKLGSVTVVKLDLLKSLVGKEKPNVAKLRKAWRDFVPDFQLSGEMDFVFEYCDKTAQVQAYIIDGIVNFCEKSEKRLEDINRLQEDYLITLDAETEAKLEQLFNAVQQSEASIPNLNDAWALCVKTADKDMVKIDMKKIVLIDMYCDKIHQSKAWIITGLVNACKYGKENLKKVEDLEASAGLEFDSETKKQIDRLKKAVAKCK
jgi:hypothetical protein